MTTKTVSNLVVTRAGACSLHHNWLLPDADRNFDVLVAAYDQAAIKSDTCGVMHMYVPGPKVAGWNEVFLAKPELLTRYQRIAFIDDDIETNSTTLAACFDVGQSENLLLWQPSLSWKSYATFGATLRNSAFQIRYVNCVEMMCPFFEASYLTQVLPLFSLGFESGIDLIWCSLTEQPERRFAIVDCLEVTHTRPVGRKKAANGFVNRDYESDIYRCLSLFSTPWPCFVAQTAKSLSGENISSRFLIGLSTIRLLGSVIQANARDRVWRSKIVADHVRHQLTRRPIYAQGAMSTLLQARQRNRDA